MTHTQKIAAIARKLQSFNHEMNVRPGEIFNPVTFQIHVQKSTHYSAEEIMEALDTFLKEGRVEATGSHFLRVVAPELAQNVPTGDQVEDVVKAMLKHFSMRTGHVIQPNNIVAYFGKRLSFKMSEVESAINALSDRGYLIVRTNHSIELTSDGDDWLWT